MIWAALLSGADEKRQAELEREARLLDRVDTPKKRKLRLDPSGRIG